MKFLFVLFLVVPLVEIYLLIKIGSVVGAGMTIFLVVFTAFLGAILVRAQGFSTLARMQAQMATAQLPAMEIMEGVFLFVAGALLLTPGFFTDAVGFVFLTPPLRRLIIRWIIERGFMNKVTAAEGSRRARSNRVIDVEYRNID